MNIIIITQNDPFYLADNLKYLIEILPKHSKIIGCIVNDVSPFGKKETFFEKAKKTQDVFGFDFFMYYSFKFIKNKLDRSKNVRRVLNENSIPEIILEKHINDQESLEKIQHYKPDLLISILGNQIFKKPLIDLAPKGCLNLHTALLPKYRGLMPTFWVLKNNEKFTGVSVFQVDKGIDSGPIIVQEKIEIGNRSQEELIIHTKKMGMEAIAKAVDLIEKDEVVLIDNDASKKTYYSFPTRSDANEFLMNGKRYY